MEIAVLSSSVIEELFRYQKSRLPNRRFLPLVAFLCTAGLAGGLPDRVFAAVLTVFLAYTLVFQFRLLDDLNDLPFDRIAHPRRVLTQARSMTRYFGLQMALFTLNLFLILLQSGSWRRLLVFLVFNGICLVWYRWRHRFMLGSIIHSHVVLIKYPVFVYLLSTQSHESGKVTLLMAMSLVYVCFGIYEILHDKRLWSVHGARYALAGEMTVLIAIIVLMAISLLPHNGTAALLQWILVPISAGGLIVIFKRYQAGVEFPSGAYAIFLLGFFGVLTFAMGLSI